MSKERNNFRDELVYWFARLDMARQRGQAEQIKEAKRELRRLGCFVFFERPEPEPEEVTR
jgi:hypothetical protein